MTTFDQPIAAQEQSPSMAERLRAVNWPLVFIGAFVVLAVVSRFWDLGSRALHHDESLHAVFSWYEYDRWGYQHDPLMHGPLLFHLTALGYWIFGVSDATARLWPALLGIGLVASPWAFRDWIGTRGAVVTSLLLLISPTMLYYSRFIRHDIFLAAWTVLIAYGMWRYLQRGSLWGLYLAAAGWGLAYSQKEVSYLLSIVVFAFFALATAFQIIYGLRSWEGIRRSRVWHLAVLTATLVLPFTTALLLHLVGRDPSGGYSGSAYRNIAFLQQTGWVVIVLFVVSLVAAALLWNWKHFLGAAAIFYGIVILLHTNFLTYPWGIGSGIVGALGYWIEQHDVARGDQPWYYYSMLVPLYEFLPLLLTTVGGGWLLQRAWRRRGNGPRYSAEAPQIDARALWPWFNLWWLVAIFAALSISGEKMPWLLVHIGLPFAFLAGWVADRLLTLTDWSRWREARTWVAALVILVATFATVSLFWLIFGARWPFQGQGSEAIRSTLQWVLSLAALVAAVWAMGRMPRDLSLKQVAFPVLSIVLILLTIRFAAIAAYRNADVANEPLIYTQTAPEVPMVERELAMISEALYGDDSISVGYDSGTTWPMEWYLRDYPNRFNFGSSVESSTERLREADVVLASQDSAQQVRESLPEFISHPYRMRPNFPEDYKKLRNVVVWTPDPDNPGQNTGTVSGQSTNPINLLRNLTHYASIDQARRDFLDFYWERRPKSDLGRYDFTVFVNPKIASQVWQYGLSIVPKDPALIAGAAGAALSDVEAQRVLGGGVLKDPKDVDRLPDGTLVVADGIANQIVLLDEAGDEVGRFGSAGTAPGQFNEPWGVAAAADGTIYVADTWNHRIQHLDREGTVLAVWGQNGIIEELLASPFLLFGPRDIAINGEGQLLVTDTGNKRVLVFSPEGEFVTAFGGEGSEPGQFSEPVGINIAPDGTIWVADTWNRRVQSFSSSYEPLSSFEVNGWLDTTITNKPSIAVSDEQVWVSDPDVSRIIEFTREGELQRIWGLPGSALNRLDKPYGLLWSEGRLIVADSGNQRLLEYALTGER